ncbi:MAG: NAD-dependent protein deacylase [Promethearchaeota archaeon]
MVSETHIQKAAQFILESSSTVALTGAGVSTESGIPDFRGPNGLWTKVDASKFASVDAFLSDPKGWWLTALELSPTIMNAKPNPAHKILAKLEKMGLIQWLVTQNVDGLHKQAGSKNVLEVHGSLSSASCIVCRAQVGRRYLEKAIKKRWIPPTCPDCGGILKLDAVLFGEGLPREAMAEAVNAARTCRLMLVVGSSLLVYPVATLPSIARQSGAHLIIINHEETPFDDVADLVFHAEAGDILTRITEIVKRFHR